ncbi:histidine triad nucleotide-binding protein 1-like [Acanthaster planci]|uniref:Histidine triad nucleotide-binding protein 1-like n=1 Tax=Acanthaster planci TaxID=133434 RepID=A0A8B7XG52_ACAPL|nr:histidine triad nucleotide-binding protein 1-like [Acanthaster planci]
MALRQIFARTWTHGKFPGFRSVYDERLTDVARARGALFCQLRSLTSDESSSEEKLAADAARRHNRDKPNVFQKIISGDIQADTIYEDEQCMAFRDVNPVAPTHIIVIPRKPIPCLSESTDSDAPLLGHLMTVARKVAALEELKDGFRIVMNDGRHGSQSIYHLHVHVIGGRQMRWPPG